MTSMLVDVNWLSWPGSAPGGPVTFLLRKRKVTKRKTPPLSASFAGATETCGARFVRGLAKLATLKQRQPLSAQSCAPRRIQRGTPDAGSVALCATSRLGRDVPSPQPSPASGRGSHTGAKAVRIPAFTPSPLRGEGWGEGLALRAMPGIAGPAVRSLGSPSQSACAACFWRDQERDCLSAASSSAPPPKVRSAGCPEGVAASGGGLSFGDFSLATQRKVTALSGAQPDRGCLLTVQHGIARPTAGGKE